MAVRIYHSLDDLERDLKTVAVSFKPRAAEQVRDVARDGNKVGRSNARRSSGAHGKHYPKAFSAERITPLSWEWGPDAAKPQGGMSFEHGSRNQPPHHDIARAADIHGAHDLAARLDRVLDRLFWP